MALSFTSIPDRTGPAIYLLGDGTSQTEQALMQLGNEVDKLTSQDTQVVYLDPSRGDGLATATFYGLTQFPSVIIVMDDDTVPHQWSHHIPRYEEVTYALSQTTGSMRSS